MAKTIFLDEFFSDPSLLDLSPDAKLFHVWAAGYCARVLNDRELKRRDADIITMTRTAAADLIPMSHEVAYRMASATKDNAPRRWQATKRDKGRRSFTCRS